jgi:large subunit ribosomal protein L13
MKHTIDATNKKVGRVASEAAALLIGKSTTDFAKNNVTQVVVEITNAAKADISPEKLEREYYRAYSHFPGGYKETTWKRTVEKKGFKEIFIRAIDGMLPKNKLRSRRLKNLTVTD